MVSRLLALFLCLTMACGASFAQEAADSPAPVLRALLIASDDFVTQPDTTPSSYNNVVALRRALLYDSRGYQRIKVSVNQALDQQAFLDLVAAAYEGAKATDINVFYLSTHGIQQEGSGDFFALLSDGEKETLLSGAGIHAALQTVPGTKIVILDACYSGAAINKGMNSPQVTSRFAGPEFKVLTSAGGLEPSFLWTDGAGTVQGGSFFAQALTEGISASGLYAADVNKDGTITLNELYTHQLKAYGASTPRVYPLEDQTPVLVYRTGRPTGTLRAVTGLMLESAALEDPQEPLVFSYTLNQQARLAYQLIYEQEEDWRFNQPQSIAEIGRGDGIVLPGRKEAALRLQSGLNEVSGYLLLMLISVFEDRSRPQACVLLSVQTKEKQQDLRLETAPVFNPQKGEEAAFILRHQGPITYTAAVLNDVGETVVTLKSRAMSRPMHLQPEGSSLSWNGRTRNGELAAPGLYTLKVTVWSGGVLYEVISEPFRLFLGEEAS